MTVEQLKTLGYEVEDMGVVYGPEFEGQFRWLNVERGTFQDWGTSYSSADAWADAALGEQQHV